MATAMAEENPSRRSLSGARIYTAAHTSLQDQLRSLVRVEQVRILDLFREWDENR